ncbi:hypothetical protein JCM5350_004263 [Sporobolomyces pararoseus]
MRAGDPSGVAQQASTSTEGDSHVQETDKVNSVRDMSTTAPGQGEVMTDDMKLAISALGLLRNEGTVGGGGGEPSNSAPHQPHLSSSSAAAAGPSYHSAHQYRSTSTASTSTASDAWGTSSSTFLRSGSETGTGTSSPLTTTSIAPSDGEGMDYFKRGQADQEGEDVEGVEGDARFIERVSQLPLVSGGLEWYERSKANSRVVKYGAGLVESSFSAVSRPITNNLQLGPLDDFACRQLDRIGAPNRSPTRKDGEPSRSSEDEERERRERTPPSQQLQQQRPEDEYPTSEGSPGGQIAVQHGQRSRWQTVLVEAGGLGAAVSEESLKSLRYCLQWLVYATAHLDHQISTLRDFILSLRAHNRAHPSGSSSNRDQVASTALVAASASAHLTQIKHDVVETIRKVVEVVSKYAGAALPEQAKRYVKQSIMGLPVKWASAIESRGTAGGGGGASSSGMNRQGSESDNHRVERMGEAYFNGNGGGRNGTSRTREERERDEAEAEARAALGPTEEAADRVLTFAVESLDMLRSVASIFGESVEKAEAWIERLRIVGLQRQRQRREQEQQQQAQQFSIEPPPPSSASSSSMHWNPSDSNSASGGMKRRRGATQGRHGSVADDAEGENYQNLGNGGEGDGGMTDGEEMIVSEARRKRGARSREMSAQLS